MIWASYSIPIKKLTFWYLAPSNYPCGVSETGIFCADLHISYNSQQNTFLVHDPHILHICRKIDFNMHVCVCMCVKAPLCVQSSYDLCEASSLEGFHEAPSICAKSIGAWTSDLYTCKALLCMQIP